MILELQFSYHSIHIVVINRVTRDLFFIHTHHTVFSNPDLSKKIPIKAEWATGAWAFWRRLIHTGLEDK